MARPGLRQVTDEGGRAERLSHAAENYLLSLYVLKEEGERATPGHLADYIRSLPATEGLGTSLPSVLGMLRRMAREGLIVIPSSKDIQFTTKGQSAAEAVVRRHRLAECMVVDLLGLPLHKAHVEAHRLEHAISHDLEELIRDRLGRPTRCPFGRPIPGSGPTPQAGRASPLSDATAGAECIVDRVPEENPDLLEFLVDHGVMPDARITVVEAGQYRGVMVLRTEGGEVSLGYQAAARLRVRPA